jgi:serine-type D-Ala-D-Ala carboxypeptidase (penicillin-binding protein 5/6)
VVAIAAAITVLAAVAAIVATRTTSTPPTPTVHVAAPAEWVAVPGPPAAIPLPASGSLTLTEPPAGAIADLQGDLVRPIGSVAKTMTALVVLDAHPLQLNEVGPALVMTAADAALYRDALVAHGSVVSVRAGERWYERDLLLALLLPSANNIAETLARWVSGDERAFTALLNRKAGLLGMTHTHFEDASGVSDRTVSTARDLVMLGKAALANATLAGLVSTRAAQLPDGEHVSNLDTLLTSQPGWLGIKTGWTPSAGGCLLFAAARTYPSTAAPVMLFGAVLGQPAKAGVDPGHPELGGALQAAALAVRTELESNLVAIDIGALKPPASGSVSTRWGPAARVVAGAARAGYAVLRRGSTFRLRTSVTQPATPLAAGATVGRVSGVDATGMMVSWPLRSTAALGGPSWWWKLFHA